MPHQLTSLVLDLIITANIVADVTCNVNAATLSQTASNCVFSRMQEQNVRNYSIKHQGDQCNEFLEAFINYFQFLNSRIH